MCNNSNYLGYRRVIISSRSCLVSHGYSPRTRATKMTGQVTDRVGERAQTGERSCPSVIWFTLSAKFSTTGDGSWRETFSPKYRAALLDSYHVKCLVIVNPIIRPSETVRSV